MNKGDRVGAIICTVDKENGKEVKIVKFAGYGTYQGEEIPEKGKVFFMGIDFSDFGRTNPKILLDNDSIVWGCQCWWGSEDKIKSTISQYESIGYKIEQVNSSYWEHQP